MKIGGTFGARRRWEAGVRLMLLLYWGSNCRTRPAGDNYIQAWNTPLEDHLNRARKLPFARDAEDEFCDLGGNNRDRRQAIIPLIRAEIARRDSLKLTETAEPQAEAVTV
jgi:hypothetical protein